jgi:hypothetical protein
LPSDGGFSGARNGINLGRADGATLVIGPAGEGLRDARTPPVEHLGYRRLGFSALRFKKKCCCDSKIIIALLE